MALNARTYRVFIASPADAHAERAIVKKVIDRWNSVFARAMDSVLLPVGWETHVAPQTGTHPQDAINRDAMAQCDIMVAVFRSKLGKPTDRYPSGTVEEIEEFKKIHRETMIYFYVPPSGKPPDDPTEYVRLQQYRSNMSDALYQTYDSAFSFQEKVYDHLSQTVLKLCKKDPAEAAIASATRPAIPAPKIVIVRSRPSQFDISHDVSSAYQLMKLREEAERQSSVVQEYDPITNTLTVRGIR